MRDLPILITGGAGFLGRHLQAALQHSGFRHIVAPTHQAYDLRDRDAVRAMYAAHQPTTVIHLAANVGGIGANRARPAEFFYDNLMMGSHVLHEAWAAGVEKVVLLGTICAYPKFAPLPFQEDDLWHGYPEETNAPYGLAKKMQLVQAQAYRAQYGFNAIYLLPVNLYGPGDNFDPTSSHVIPALIRRFSQARDEGWSEVVVWGTGNATREFLFVEDCARAIVLATERYNGAEPVNLGSGMELSIRELAERIASAVGFSGRIVWDSSKPDGQPRRRLDISRAAHYFGFQAEVGFEEGLQRTVAWYQMQPQQVTG